MSSISQKKYTINKMFNLNLLHSKSYFVCGEELRTIATRICRWFYRLQTTQVKHFLKFLLFYRNFQIYSKFPVYQKVENFRYLLFVHRNFENFRYWITKFCQIFPNFWYKCEKLNIKNFKLITGKIILIILKN